MRRHRTLTVILVAMTALAMAATALAKPPEGKGKPEPSIEGMTCAEYFGSANPGPEVYTENLDGFTLTISEKGVTCVDVINELPGTWTVDVTVGSAREVTVQLRSSVPGDWCWVESTKEDQTFTFTNTPASDPGACPIGGADGDPITDNDEPLAFTAYYTGGKMLKTPVVITVTLPLP